MGGIVVGVEGLRRRFGVWLVEKKNGGGGVFDVSCGWLEKGLGCGWL